MSELINADMIPELIKSLGGDILDVIYDNSLVLGREIAVPALKDAVQERVYDAYTPSRYDRTDSLKDSIEPFGDKMVATSMAKRKKKSVKFGAYFDTSTLLHWSQMTPSGKPERTWGVPLWANYGWSWVKGMSIEDIRHPKAPPRQGADTPHYLSYGCKKIMENGKVEMAIQRLFKK